MDSSELDKIKSSLSRCRKFSNHRTFRQSTCINIFDNEITHNVTILLYREIKIRKCLACTVVCMTE